MYILGITDGHECSAALMKKGEIIAAAQEERFSGLKCDYEFPKQSIDYCLKYAGITGKDLEAVVLASEYLNPVLTYFKRNAVFSVNDWILEQNLYWKPKLLENQNVNYYNVFNDKISENKHYYNYKDLFNKPLDKEVLEEFQKRRIDFIASYLQIPKNKIQIINHERCHKAYAVFSTYDRDEKLIFVTEGSGTYSNGNLSIFNGREIKEITNTRENHIAHIYQYTTLLLGMKPGQHEYKVMGLAPYANEKEMEKSYKVFKDMLKVENHNIIKNIQFKDVYFYLKERLEGHRFDGIAAAVQKVTEELLCEWVEKAVEEFKINNLVFCGGVGQNIKALKAVAEVNNVKTAYVPQAAGDSSNSIGACYAFMHKYCLENSISLDTIKPLKSMYLGAEYTNEEIWLEINKSGIKDKYKIIDNADNKLVAKKLAEGNVIARMCGRMEFGLRALGNRSILANPKNYDIVRKINQQIKFRDFWMPFTPSVLDKYAEKYIVNPKNLLCPFMTMAFDTTERAQKDLPAALHPADFTIRPQILEESVNSSYYELISEFEKLTGIGAVLNTSFNLHGDPIVKGPKEAIYTFENSELDMLLMNDILISRI